MPKWIRKPLIALGIIAAIATVGGGAGFISSVVIKSKERESRKLYKDVVKRLSDACGEKQKGVVAQFKATHWPDEGETAKADLNDWAQYCAEGNEAWLP